MRLFKTIKPSAYFKINKHKHSILSLLTPGCKYVETDHVSGYTYHVAGIIYVKAFNFVKHNRKVTREGKTSQVTPMYWDVFSYDIPVSMLEYMGVKLTQNSRNFSIKSI